MSVLRKALRFAILACIISGCAAADSSTRASSSPGETKDAVVDVHAGAIGESNAPASASNTSVVRSEELASAKDAGFGIRIERGNGFSRILVDTAHEPVFDVKSMQNPPRLVVDLLGEKQGANRILAVNDDQFVKSVRIGAHKDRARIVLDLTPAAADSSRVDHQIDTDSNHLIVSFADSSANNLASIPAVSAASDSPAGGIVAKSEPVPAPIMKSVASDSVKESAVDVASAPEAAASNGSFVLNSLTFTKKAGAAGTVTLGLNDEVAFELRQAAPTEYVLNIPSATASDKTKLPQIAPMGFPGIRSARAVQNGDGINVRMFVDNGVTLRAKPDGHNIIVEPQASKTASLETTSSAARNPDMRAQLGGGDSPEGEAPSAEAAKSPAAPNETVARTNPTGIPSADGSKIYTGRLISLDLQDTDIDNALRIIAEVSNLNIIASDEVTGKVTLRLIDVPWDQALDVILKTNGLDQVTEGNVIRIAPVEKLRAEREALLEAKRAAENLEDLRVRYVRVSYARVSEMKEQVEAVLSERGSVTVDDRTNQLIIKDIAKGQEESMELIKKLDLRTPQVLLETQIVEASRNILRDLGFQWNFQYSRSPETGNATGYVFPNSVGLNGSANAGQNQMVNFPAVLTETAGSAVTAILDSADGSRALSARLTALEREGRVKVVSRPQVATVNNKQAEIKSVETVRVRLPDSGLSVATGSGASASGGGSTAFEEIDVGITLTVTPQASPDYYVLMDINAQSSTFGSHTTDNIPSTLEREATSTILVKSGQTFALGGVYRINDNDNVDGVPWLKDIPVLGHAFRRTLVNKTDEELIFFITPHIVEGSFDPSLM